MDFYDDKIGIFISFQIHFLEISSYDAIDKILVMSFTRDNSKVNSRQSPATELFIPNNFIFRSKALEVAV